LIGDTDVPNGFDVDLELLLLSMYQPPYIYSNYDYIQVYGHTQAYISLGVELFKNID
jgi:hypothetical protein